MSLGFSRIRLMPLMLLAAAASGCAAFPTAAKKSKLHEPVSEVRKAEVVAQYESQRDAAQLQAALHRWREGNADACQQALAKLVASRPEFIEARVQYAELLLSRNELAAAEAQLREALRLAPQRAEVHHCLALVLESSNPPAAAEQFRQAAELEPDNPLYQLALENCANPPIEAAAGAPGR